MSQTTNARTADATRLESLSQTLARFATGDFSEWAALGPDGDELDAIAAGINMLAEEVQFAQTVLEAQVADRTRELQAAVENLEQQRNDLRVLAAVIDATHEPIITCDVGGLIRTWNPAAEATYGCSRSEMLGQPLTVLLTEEIDDLAVRLQDLGDTRFETVHRRNDGSVFPVAVTLSALRSGSGVITGYAEIVRDISESKRAEAEAERSAAKLSAHAEKLAGLALHDSLTGLGNRALLRDRLDHALMRREAAVVTVMMVDLDDFKSVNDLGGHAAGDQLLVEVAHRLEREVRPSDTVARLGGDEFAIVVEGDVDAPSLAARLVASIAVPVDLEGRRVIPSCSIGVASGVAGSASTDALMRRSDLALYAAKDGGKGVYAVYRSEMADSAAARDELTAGLRGALEAGEIVVHYQPIMSVAGATMSGVEALMRWERPTGMLDPAAFRAIAQQIGVDAPIGREVLTRSVADMADWLREDPTRTLSVNVSAAYLIDPGFAAEIAAHLSAAAIAPRQLVMEINEAVLDEVGVRATRSFEELRAQGVRIGISGFGAGSSSLGRLRSLPIDAVKLDPNLVGDIKRGTEDLPVLFSAIALAHGLGFHVTADGVSTAVQAARLMALGCDALQGDHFGDPCPPADLVAAGNVANDILNRFGFAEIVDDTAIDVLIVDDDPTARAIVRLQLGAAGLAVHEAASLAEADQVLARVRPHCVLVDLGLPDGDGAELVRSIRSDPRMAGAAVIVLTGAADRPTKVRAFEAGADDYIVKPILGQFLAHHIRGALRAALLAKPHQSRPT